MLAALLLLGILPLAMMPMSDGGTSDDVSDDGSSAPDPAVTGGSLLDAGDLELTESEAGPADAGETYQVDPASGETTFDGFQPGVDIVQFDLTALEGDVTYELDVDENGASVSFLVGDDAASTLVFSDLQQVPTGDIMLAVLDPETGEAFQLSLSDVDFLAQQGVEIGLPIDPVDPDAPDPEVPGTDPTTGLDPVDPETPDPPSPGPVVGDVLEPVGDGEVISGPAANLLLNELLARDSENLVGSGAALAAALAAGVQDTQLTDGADVAALADDGVAGTGEGSLAMFEAIPVLASGGAIAVLDGAAGDDSLTTGDAAAFAFGGAGADTIAGGEGAAALFGGAGNDALSASDTSTYLDGGAGDDLVLGGSGNDILEGGEHSAESVSGNDTLSGGAGDDQIRGGYGADVLAGGAGDDVIDHLGRTEEREIIEHHEFAWHLDGASDRLDGGDGDDTLIFDREDSATGGAGNDLFWLYFDGADTGGVADVTDFTVGQDFLRVSLNPAIGENGEPIVEVAPSADGNDGLVTINGDLVAILRGAPGATVSDIYAEVQPDVFPSI